MNTEVYMSVMFALSGVIALGVTYIATHKVPIWGYLTWVSVTKSKSLMEFDEAAMDNTYMLLCGILNIPTTLTVYKLHIAKDFIDKPWLISNNGPGKGAHVYFSYETMLDVARYSPGVYWYCTCEVEAHEINILSNSVGQMLIDKNGSDFKPVPLWGK